MGWPFTLLNVVQATQAKMAILRKANRLIIYAPIKACKIRGNGLVTILLHPVIWCSILQGCGEFYIRKMLQVTWCRFQVPVTRYRLPGTGKYKYRCRVQSLPRFAGLQVAG